MKFSYRRRGRTAEEEVCPRKPPAPHSQIQCISCSLWANMSQELHRQQLPSCSAGQTCGFGERNRKFETVHEVLTSSFSLDTEHCLQSCDPTWSRSVNTVLVHVWMDPQSWNLVVTSPNIKRKDVSDRTPHRYKEMSLTITIIIIIIIQGFLDIFAILYLC